MEHQGLIAVAIDKDKNTQFAVKWAVNNLDCKSGFVLIHVKTQQNLQPQESVPKAGRAPTQSELHQFFLSYRGFCARKGINAQEVVLHDLDIACALSEFISNNFVTTIVLGASNRSALTRAFRNTDVPTALGKIAPDFCRVYSVAKDKAQTVKSATTQPPTPAASRSESISRPDTPRSRDASSHGHSFQSMSSTSEGSLIENGEVITLDRSSRFRQFPERPGSINGSSLHSMASSKNSSPMQSAMSSTNNSPHSRMSPSPGNSMTGNDFMGMTPQNRMGNNFSPHYKYRNTRSKDNSFRSGISSSNTPSSTSFISSDMSFENMDPPRTSNASQSTSSFSQTAAEIEEEIKRLRRELKQTMEMFNSASQETVTANKKVREIDEWKSHESEKLHEAKKAQEMAMIMVEIERQKCKVAVEAAQKAQHLAELEAQRRKSAESRFHQEEKEKKKAIEALANNGIRCRKYTIEEIEIATKFFAHSEKIGEGGYGPVFKGFLDHTSVAIKVLRPDMSEGQQQFDREVDVLSSMRHPNMVLLVGACPEYGCLVYEYMENGSLEDRLFRKNHTRSLPWPLRFKIAAEIGTALLFLHQAKPEPLVHRDLKPGNILLDRNFVSKISDVGLSKLVPATVADSVTQYCMTAAAGTFCYIDPEYQQTGMLGTKSDIYSLGIILLQIITAKPPMGLSHQVENAIEGGRFKDILDPTVKNWPIEEALSLARIALRCCELRKRDRPDLDTEILPELERLSNLKPGNGGRVGPQ